MLKNQMIYVMTHHLGIIFSWIIRIVKHGILIKKISSNPASKLKYCNMIIYDQLNISINISMCNRSDTQF